MKLKLDKTDKKLIDQVAEITRVDYEIDENGYIETDNLISLVDDLYKEYVKLENKFVEYDKKVNEDYREHFINEQIDRGMHPHEYE